MRGLRAVVLIGLLVKAVVLGMLCGGQVARAAAQTGGKDKGAAKSAAGGVGGDALANSRGFREMLASVETRTGQLDQREQGLVAREAALKALEKTLGVEVARLEAQGGLRPAGAKAGAAPAGGGAASTPAGGGEATITKIYESMKPEEAAPILDKLDDGTVKAIFGHMKEKQIGALLAVMNRERAVALTKVLAGGSGPALGSTATR